MRVTVEGPVMSGKTTTICLMAAALSAAGQEVTIVNREDHWARLSHLLEDAGGDLDKVRFAVADEPSTDRVVFYEQHAQKSAA